MVGLTVVAGDTLHDDVEDNYQSSLEALKEHVEVYKVKKTVVDTYNFHK